MGLYVSDHLDFRIRTDIYAYEDEVMESLFIEKERNFWYNLSPSN